MRKKRQDRFAVCHFKGCEKTYTTQSPNSRFCSAGCRNKQHREDKRQREIGISGFSEIEQAAFDMVRVYSTNGAAVVRLARRTQGLFAGRCALLAIMFGLFGKTPEHYPDIDAVATTDLWGLIQPYDFKAAIADDPS